MSVQGSLICFDGWVHRGHQAVKQPFGSMFKVPKIDIYGEDGMVEQRVSSILLLRDSHV